MIERPLQGSRRAPKRSRRAPKLSDVRATCASLAISLGVLAACLWQASSARAQPRIVLPECPEVTHLDLSLLAQLLTVELSGDVTVEIEASLCDAEANHAVVTVVTPRGTERERVPVLGEAPAGRARALALAIAERVHLLMLPASSSGVRDEPSMVDEASAPDAPSAPDESGAAEFDGPDFDVDAAFASLGAPAPPTPPPTIEVVALARLAPIAPSGAIGLRSEAHAHVDRYWSLSLGVTATWSHAQLAELSPQVLVGALSGSVGWTPYRDHVFDIVVAARGEIGAALVGGAGVSETALPWATLGADAALLLWPHASLGVVLEMGVSGVIAGTSVYTMFGEPILQLTGLVLDLTLGFRVPLE